MVDAMFDHLSAKSDSGLGQFRSVPVELKLLASLEAATLIGCPF